MTRRITQLIEKQENRMKPFDTRCPEVKAAKSLRDSQKIGVFVLDIDEVVPLSPGKGPQQREVPIPKENKNQNGKITTEMKLTGK